MNEANIKTEKFHGNELTFMQDSSGMIYVEIDSILAGIGLVEKQVIFHRAKWQLDRNISKGIQEYYCEGKPKQYFVSLEKLPYGLACFNSKSQMICANPSIKETLEVYQDELIPFAEKLYVDASKLRDEVHETVIPAATPSSLPLSREELAAFMMYEEQHVDIIEKTMTSFMQNQTSILQSFIATQAEVQKQFNDTVLAIMNSIKGQEKTAECAYSEHHVVDDYVATKNPSFLNSVYSEMKRNGWNLADYKERYSNATNTRFPRMYDVVNHYPELKQAFDECYKLVFSRKDVVKENPACTPAIIKEKMDPLVFEGESSRMMQRRIYREMENQMGHTMKELIIEFRKKYGVKNASVAYMIANTPELLELFDKVVKSCL